MTSMIIGEGVSGVVRRPALIPEYLKDVTEMAGDLGVKRGDRQCIGKFEKVRMSFPPISSTAPILRALTRA